MRQGGLGGEALANDSPRRTTAGSLWRQKRPSASRPGSRTSFGRPESASSKAAEGEVLILAATADGRLAGALFELEPAAEPAGSCPWATGYNKTAADCGCPGHAARSDEPDLEKWVKRAATLN